MSEHAGREHELINHRYQPLFILGEGGFGQVWCARDIYTDQDVSLKLFIHDEALMASERWREASILRGLQLPGVVPLLDEGVHEGVAYIVTELIEGHPFPRMEDANVLLERATALLELLSSMHAHGVIHGDIKPDNVYIQRDGRLMLLDFGLSKPAATLRNWQDLPSSGSPLYMAPEQFQGMDATPASDMYAAGVMLFESLTGAYPHDARTKTQLLRMRLLQDAPPVRERYPQTPEPLAELIDVMLQRDPERRLEHTRAWLARHVRQQHALVNIPREALENVLDHCERGESVDVMAQPGSGRRTLMREVLDILRQRGHEPLELVSGHEPFESLRRALRLDFEEHEPLTAIRARTHALLLERMKQGVVVVIWNPERLDSWSLELLLEARKDGPILMRTSTSRGGHAIAPPRMSPEQLGELFHGPRKIYHVSARMGHEIYRRTGGYIPQVQSLLRLLERHHLIHLDEPKYRIALDAIELLESGWDLPQRSIEEARHDLATLPARAHELIRAFLLIRRNLSIDALCAITGQPRWWIQAYAERLTARGLLVSHGDALTLRPEYALAMEMSDAQCQAAIDELRRTLSPDDMLRVELPPTITMSAETFTEETLTLAHTLDLQGDIPGALSLLERAWEHLEKMRPSPQIGHDLCVEWARIALSTYSIRKIEIAQLYAQRVVRVCQAPLENVISLLEAARLTCRSRSQESLKALDDLGTMRDHTLELRRQMYRTRTLTYLHPEKVHEALDQMEHWLEDQPNNQEAFATLLGWRAHHMYAHANYAMAAELHARSYDLKRRRTAQLSSRIAQVNSLCDALLPERALELAQQTLEQAIELRHINYQFHAWHALRATRYRLGHIHLPMDEDILAALQWVGSRPIAAFITTQEAAFAWRNGNLERAATLAQESEDHLRSMSNNSAALLLRSFRLALSMAADPVDLKEYLEIPEPRLKAQALVLLQRIQTLPTHAKEELARCVHTVDGYAGGIHLEILSLEELRQALS